MDPTHVVLVETESGQVTISQQGNFVAVQLDGFLSDPTMFSPQFLQNMQDLVPLQSNPQSGNDVPGSDQDQGDSGLEGGGDEITQSLLDEITAGLQQIQGLDDTSLLHGALEQMTELGGDGATDALDELQELLDALNQTLDGIQTATDNLPDDVLFGNTAQDVLATLNLSSLPTNTDGSSYSAQLESMGYTTTPLTGNNATGDVNNNSIFGNANSNDLTGNAGNDIIFGGTGSDTLNGNAGNDHLYGGTGED